MNQGTIIFLVVLALALAIPIFITSLKRKKKENFFLQRMNEFAQKNNCTLSDYQLWKDLQIGIDQQCGKFLFIRNTKDNEFSTSVDLSQVHQARVMKGERVVNTGGDKYIAVDRINLHFNFGNNKPETALNFYNSGIDSPTTQGELQIAEKWKDIVNSWISAHNKIK
jgi:hypothetical protein